MKLNIFLSTSIFIILLLASCNNKEEKQHALPAPMEEIDTTHIKKSLLREIKAFVDKQDSCKAFVLYSMHTAKNKKDLHNGCIGCRVIFNDIFCIHEAADLHFDSGEFTVRRNYPHRYIDINGKIVYVPSEDDSFYDQKKLKSIVDSTVSKREHPIDKRYFILYDTKDSCEEVSYPFFSDSIYEYEPSSITPIFTKEEQISRIHFVNIKASPSHNSK